MPGAPRFTWVCSRTVPELKPARRKAVTVAPVEGTGFADPVQRLWRVFYTESRAEMTSEKYLGRIGFEAFVPKVTVTRQWSDRKKEIIEPILRGYLFAQVTESERLRVLQSPGIVRSVTFGGRPVSVRSEEIRRLEILQAAGPHLEAIDGLLPVGEAVVVAHGPMQGLEGEIVQYRGERIVIVRIDSIRMSVSVVLPVDWVRASRAESAS